MAPLESYSLSLRSPSALTKLALDSVAALQGCVQAFGGIRHRDKMRGGCGEGQKNGCVRGTPHRYGAAYHDCNKLLQRCGRHAVRA